MPTIGQDLVKLRSLRLKYDKAKATADSHEKAYKAWQWECMQRMEADEVDSHKTRGVHYIKTATTYATVQDRAAFIEWAKENEPELIEDKERAKLLNALVRSCDADGTPLPPGIGTYDREGITMKGYK